MSETRAPNADKLRPRDPAPVEHSKDQAAEEQGSRFEAKEPWRSRKGDRFS